MAEYGPGGQTLNVTPVADVTHIVGEPALSRIITFIIALILPLVSFPLGGALGSDWQTGDITQRVGLHLDPEVTIFFAPFIIIAWVGVLAAIAAEPFMSKRRLTRLMVYSSIPVSLHYLVVSSIALVAMPLLAGAVAIAAWTGHFFVQRRTSGQYNKAIALIVVGLWVAVSLWSMAATGLSIANLLTPLAFLLLAVLIGGPAISFAISVHRSVRIWRTSQSLRHEPTPVDTTLAGAGLIAWVGGYALAWRAGAARAVELYEALPVEQPQCYVATAAATGHTTLVRSDVVTASDGTAFAVTKQLQTLKLAEIVLASRTPRVHGAIRRVYDAIGPKAAARLRSPVRADLAYLALKPAEAFGAILVAICVPRARATRARIYIQPVGANGAFPPRSGARHV